MIRWATGFAAVLAFQAGVAASECPAAPGPQDDKRTEDPRARRLLDKALDALGGAKHVDSVKTLAVDGVVVQSGPAGELTVPVTIYLAFPAQVRRDVVLADGTPVSTVASPSGVFLLTPTRAVELPPAEAAQFKLEATRHPIALMQARHLPAFRVSLVEIADGTASTDALEIFHDGHRTCLLLDSGGHIVQLASQTNAAGNWRDRFEYNEFRELNGVVLPFEQRKRGEGSLHVLKASRIQINSPLGLLDFTWSGDGGKVPPTTKPAAGAAALPPAR